MKKIYLQNDNHKPIKAISVDEFYYTITTSSGEAIVTLPESREYTSDDYLRVEANGIKLVTDVEYERNSSTTIQAKTCDMFSDGKFPKNCKLYFELYTYE